MILWEENPIEYGLRYFHGKKGRTNRGQALGTEVADSLETGIETGKLHIDIVVAQMPKYAIRDKELRCQFSIGKGKQRSYIPVLIKPDSVMEDYTRFYEYKTYNEKYPWTQRRVDDDDQMTFYTAGLYMKIRSMGGVEIPTGELIAASTQMVMDDDGIERPRLTGDIKRFPTKRSFAQILEMQARMARAWRQIGEAMEKEIL